MAKSQEPQQAVTGVNVALPPLDEEMRTPTPREAKLAELAKKNAEIAPQRYDITSKNKAALRVVYDHNGHSVTIAPGGRGGSDRTRRCRGPADELPAGSSPAQWGRSGSGCATSRCGCYRRAPPPPRTSLPGSIAPAAPRSIRGGKFPPHAREWSHRSFRKWRIRSSIQIMHSN